MPLTEIPLSVLFLLFLVIFMLVGLYPAWKRVSAKLRRLFKSRDVLHSQDTAQFQKESTAGTAKPLQTEELDSYESILFRRLAQDDRKGLSRKQLASYLHLSSEHVTQALKSLSRRGLIRVSVTQLLGVRFTLSDQGYSYALKHDFILRILKSAGRS